MSPKAPHLWGFLFVYVIFVRFKCMQDKNSVNQKVIFEDNFENKLNKNWSWLRENKEYWRIQNNGLEIRVLPGDENTVRNALILPAPDRNSGTYSIEITVSNYTHPIQPYEQAGITWYNDGKPVAKIVKELIDPPNVPHKSGGNIFIFPGDVSIQQEKVRLRLLVSAHLWIAQYHFENNLEFHTAATGELPLQNNDHVSIQCFHGPQNAEHWVRFENFQIKYIP